MKNIFIIFILFSITSNVFNTLMAQNKTISRFVKAKDIMRGIYADHPQTFYCGCEIEGLREINLKNCSYRPHDKKNVRSLKIEWEHVVPASLFGQKFTEWNKGSNQCKHKGKKYKGRSCADKTSSRYRMIQNDLYNLYPAIGEVNEERENFKFTDLELKSSSTKDKTLITFGDCPMVVDSKKRLVSPPNTIKGMIARTYLYMEKSYPEVQLTSEELKMFQKWDSSFAVEEWECKRSKRIENIQGNENPFIKAPCLKLKLW